MTTTAPPAPAVRWRVPIVRAVEVDGRIERAESEIKVEAADKVGAWLLAQDRPGAPAVSDGWEYGTPVRIRGDR